MVGVTTGAAPIDRGMFRAVAFRFPMPGRREFGYASTAGFTSAYRRARDARPASQRGGRRRTQRGASGEHAARIAGH